MKRRIVSTNYQGLFQDWEVSIVVKLVKEFREEWPCLKMEEPNDLYQECFIHWGRVSGNYNPSRGASRKTYMGEVIQNKLIDLVRERESDKRKASYTADSLDGPLGEDEDSPILGDTIDESAIKGGSPDPFLPVDLGIDLSRVLDRLTPRQKRIWQLRKEGFSVTEASRLLKTSRSTLHDELKRIGRIFEKEGLREYLK